MINSVMQLPVSQFIVKICIKIYTQIKNVQQRNLNTLKSGKAIRGIVSGCPLIPRDNQNKIAVIYTWEELELKRLFGRVTKT